ncbi:gamma-glutamylcyclotransferase family protein [Ferrimonas balearica]|uniref:gamma-glutamylcyclotransferase family protein n=1 Tax=Ferrimonas balearica TaxID=44012 RepID=UPI001F1F336D|nr:gamma-glutamylcyclotransferase family protein [Ferrimonas balearica]MBY6096754.1 gamma-glutamylcyclotransferase [Ferrimonas balearica]
MKYFAYGSNMSLRRLQQRVPSARRLALATLPGHQMRFHKRGRDGSAKCDAFATEQVDVPLFGALFLLDPQHKPQLDLAEGLGVGYQQKLVQVQCQQGHWHRAFTYVALQLDASLQPYHWYLEHVLIGARESGLPTGYLSGLQQVISIDDPDAHRSQCERAIYLPTELAQLRASRQA